MSDGDALRRAILAFPNEDAPRLIYADYLDEFAGSVPCPACLLAEPDEGDEPHPADIPCPTCRGSRCVPDGRADRAAHIRWACANPQNSVVCLCGCRGQLPNPCETCALFGDEIADIPRRDDGETHYVANRGLVSEVRCGGNVWAFDGDTITSRHPIRRVRLNPLPHFRDCVDYFFFISDPLLTRIPAASVIDGLWTLDTIPLILLRYRWQGIEFDIPRIV